MATQGGSQAPRPNADAQYKRIITGSLLHIMQNAGNLHELIARLVQTEVINECEMERVNCRHSLSEKLSTLVLLFLRKPEGACHLFVEALNDSRNGHVAQEIGRVSERVGREARIGTGTVARQSAPPPATDPQQYPPPPPDLSETIESSETPQHTRSPSPPPIPKGVSGAFTLGETRVVTTRQHDGSQMVAVSVVTASAPQPQWRPNPSIQQNQRSESEDLALDIEDLVNLVMWVRNEIRKRMHFNMDKEFQVKRFQAERTVAGTNARKWFDRPRIQYFRTNCAVWISEVGLFGPHTIHNTQYNVQVDLIRDSGGKFTQATKIGTTHLIRTAKQDKIFFLPFVVPVGIEPNVWYKFVINMSGMDCVRVVNRGAKLGSTMADCAELGDVRFEFTTNWYNSTCQLAIIKFFKGKDTLLTTVFPKTSDDLCTFENSTEVRMWMEANPQSRMQPDGNQSANGSS